MNNEIKEILKNLDFQVNHTYNWVEPLGLDQNTWKTILDYINNLQEEVENLREEDWAWHQVLKMQNKREYRSKFLKDFQKEYGTNTYPDYDEIYRRYDKMKLRIDKAIKKLKNMKNIEGGINSTILQAIKEVEEIISILSGEDK